MTTLIIILASNSDEALIDVVCSTICDNFILLYSSELLVMPSSDFYTPLFQIRDVSLFRCFISQMFCHCINFFFAQFADHKKLPFMAMLRNLRNLIKAGISEKHHAWVLKKLTDDNAVINSRIFPFQFFSAYDALCELESKYELVRK